VTQFLNTFMGGASLMSIGNSNFILRHFAESLNTRRDSDNPNDPLHLLSDRLRVLGHHSHQESIFSIPSDYRDFKGGVRVDLRNHLL
jgi:hypothetical protein